MLYPTNNLYDDNTELCSCLGKAIFSGIESRLSRWGIRLFNADSGCPRDLFSPFLKCTYVSPRSTPPFIGVEKPPGGMVEFFDLCQDFPASRRDTVVNKAGLMGVARDACGVLTEGLSNSLMDMSSLLLHGQDEPVRIVVVVQDTKVDWEYNPRMLNGKFRFRGRFAVVAPAEDLAVPLFQPEMVAKDNSDAFADMIMAAIERGDG